MAIITGAYLVCNIPYFVFITSGSAELTRSGKLFVAVPRYFSKHFFFFRKVVILVYANSLVNPLLYIGINRQVNTIQCFIKKFKLIAQNILTGEGCSTQLDVMSTKE